MRGSMGGHSPDAAPLSVGSLKRLYHAKWKFDSMNFKNCKCIR